MLLSVYADILATEDAFIVFLMETDDVANPAFVTISANDTSQSTPG